MVIKHGLMELIFVTYVRTIAVKKKIASFHSYEEACNMLCGKGLVRTQNLDTKRSAMITAQHAW